MSFIEPAASGYELTASEIDPAHHAIVPSDEQQDVAFRSIRAIDARSIQPFGSVSVTSERKTPKGVRPMIWIRLNETKSAVVFEVTLHTGQCVQVHVPYESWRLATCEPEAVRAAIQKAYLNLLRHKPDPAIVKPGMVSLKVLSKHDPQHRTMLQTIQQQSLRQSSLDSTSTRTSFDSSRYTSSQNNTRHSSHGHSRSQGSRTPQRAYSHPVPPQPPVRPNVLTRLNTSGAALGSHSRSQPPSPAQLSPYVHINHNGQPFVRVNQPNTGHAGFDPYAGGRYVTYGH